MENSKTTFRPILFSTPMVQAILENRKTMTRRTKGLEKFNETLSEWRYDGISEEVDYAMELLENGKPKEIYCEIFPAYNIGDVLWVRENFYTASNWDHWKPSALKSVNVEVFYVADLPNHNIPRPLSRGKTRHSIFMPKSACRIFLKVKAIRVERLQDISEEDAIAEGIEFVEVIDGKIYYNYETLEFGNSPFISFMSLWISINGKESWKTNPFVFVYEFEQIEKPLDFT